jgi:hypothetical protein
VKIATGTPLGAAPAVPRRVAPYSEIIGSALGSIIAVIMTPPADDESQAVGDRGRHRHRHHHGAALQARSDDGHPGRGGDEQQDDGGEDRDPITDRHRILARAHHARGSLDGSG